MDEKSNRPIPKPRRKPIPKPRKSLTENFRDEILNCNVPELKQCRNKLRSQIQKLKEESNILKSKIDEIDIEIEERNHYRTTYKEMRINLSHNNLSSPDEYFDKLEDSIKGEILNELRINQTIKCKLIIKVTFLLERGEIVYPYFHGELEILYSKDDFEDFYNSQKISIMNKIQSYVNRASIQKFIGMEFIDIYFYGVTPLNGSSYITPLFNNSNNNMVNIQNYNDNDCFVWSILAKIHY